MADPISTEDLYGTSSKETPASGESSASDPSLKYEETPEIPINDHVSEAADTPVPASPGEQTPPQAQPSLPPVGYLPKKQSGSSAGGFIKIVFFLILFAVGIWLSSFVRQFIPSASDIPFLSQKPKTSVTPTPVGPDGTIVPTVVTTPAWKTYQVISGTTRKPIDGVSFLLPSELLAPICDGTNCISQGTYLPGGTRFTVAARGAGQILPDFRGTVISDVGGITFTSKQVTVLGRPSTDFTGVFTGRTISGYAFSKMHGFMIPVSATLSLEINHFTPSGIIADFEKDDLLFADIVQKLTFSGAAPSDKGAVLVTFTPTPTRAILPTFTVSPTSSPTPTGY